MITEIAPLDALRQRFGRLDRLGERAGRSGLATPEFAGAIVAAAGQVDADGAGNADWPDPVYGHALARTWAWLIAAASGDPPGFDFGIEALEPRLPEGDELARLCTDTARAYPLLPAHLDLLTQTSPPAAPEPEISAFLHGNATASPDVTLVWRCDLPEDDPDVWVDRITVQPPCAGEGCATPVWDLRRWLAAPASAAEDAGDVEGVALSGPDARGGRLVLRWRGANEAEVVDAARLAPGDVAVLPSAYGGCDEFGWNPAGGRPVTDIGDAVAFTSGRRPVLRLQAAAAALSGIEGSEDAMAALGDLAEWAGGGEDAPEPGEALGRLAGSAAAPAWLRELAAALAQDRGRRMVDIGGAYAFTGRRGTLKDLDVAQDGSPAGGHVCLTSHSTGVEELARRFAEAVALPQTLVADLAFAGWLHDVGKADPRFQTWLFGGDEAAAASAEALLAKSAQNPRDRRAVRLARERSGYPRDGRHEAQSLALISGHAGLRSRATDWDLVQHLVVSHHGFGRPFLPVVLDPEPVEVALEHGGVRLCSTSGHGLHELGSGVAERYWRLVRCYGWWGLAWLEAIVRLADHRRSEQEQRDEVDHG